ncbi:IclR family transcriptional regulator C-terminal domain-containing protein [Arthrobacter sp.]|uniref:IclR family transcriptional regulator n=1 Tax=Arthrobacter sp. TaxID=1667 RepID=UPI003398F20F
MRHGANDQRSVVAKAADVLSAFSADRAELTLAEITRRAKLPHATARRLVNELVSAAFLERTDRRTYVVGIKMWETGALAPRTLPLRAVAMPFMSLLHEALRQHVQLAVLEGDEAVVIERLSASRAVGVLSHVGGRLPLHASGVGKVLLAHAPREISDQVMAKPLPGMTEFSITDPGILARELASVRAQGYAIVREEVSLGAGSVAAKIAAPNGVVIAALSVVVDTRRSNIQSLVPAVVSAAKGISGALKKA